MSRIGGDTKNKEKICALFYLSRDRCIRLRKSLLCLCCCCCEGSTVVAGPLVLKERSVSCATEGEEELRRGHVE